jgi:putative NIF3 family GTP cyclohydrolase 1 type 2
MGGVNHCLADKVGIKSLVDCPEDEFLKMGSIEPMNADEFAEIIKAALGGKVTYTDSGKQINKVAVCSGSGGDLVRAATIAGADALLTGEAKYHEILDSREAGIALFVAGHYETEVVVLDYLKSSIENRFPSVEVKTFDNSPVKYK